jgi:sirohydrochlorin cobaltochelatase
VSSAAGGNRSALVLFAHGSRDLEWAAPLRSIQEKIRRQRPTLAVELAYLEFMTPSLPDVLQALVASGKRRIAIAPLFMAQGAHLREDLAGLVAAARARHPDVKIKLLPAIGEVEPIIEAMSIWIAANA